MANNAIAYTATIEGTGATTGHRIEIEVERDGPPEPGVFVDINDEVRLDADGLRRLAAACVEAADMLA